jgi:chaperonin GroES
MIKPIGKRVLIRPTKEEEKLYGGIIKPQGEDMKPMKGVVLEIGDELEDKPQLKSATVYYPRYTGAEVMVSEGDRQEKLLIVEYEDLLGFEIN